MAARKTFAELAPSIERDLKRARVKPSGAVVKSAQRFAALAVKNRAKYEAVEDATGVPWHWIAATHARESSMNFKGVLHNGEQIVGTGRKTRLVPAGRGPFATWEQAAIEALTTSPHDMRGVTDWTPARMCYEFEKWNGFGYRNKGLPSPYVWSGTSIYRSGKYVRDGGFDPNAVDTQPGTWAIVEAIGELVPTVALDLRPHVPEIRPDAPPEPRLSPRADDGDEDGGEDDGPSVTIPDVPTAVPAAGEPITDAETVKQVQLRLRELKFGFAGDPDGNLGELTKDAILAFRRVNGLPLRDTIDKDFVAVIMSADAKPRPLSEERKNAQAPELAPKHEQVNQPWWQQLYAWFLGLPAAATLAVKSWFPDADGDGVPDFIRSLSKVPTEIWAGGVLVIVFFIVLSASRAKRAAVKARQEGRLF